MVPGYHGRALRIAAEGGSVRSQLLPLDAAFLRRFLGGVGLGTALLADELRDAIGVNPLGPEASIVFALSPLVGTPLTTSAKFAVVAIGPLTRRTCDALSSSHFAIAAKRTGVDAIAISGQFAEPTILLVDGEGRHEPEVTTFPAGDLWGRPAREAEAAIRERFGASWQVAAIGVGGERMIPFATISHDGRHAGRGGLGAVLGSKRIKAIAVRGDRRTPLADPARTVELARDLSKRSMGPETAKYRDVGTVANLLVFNRFEALPTRNFREGRFEGAEELAGFDLGPSRRVARNSCAACTIGCEHIFASRSGEGARVEYESLFALGPLCGVSDPDAVVRASALCDAFGLDTISTGGTIAFAMECVERGWLDGALPRTGRPLRFGDAEALLEAIASIPDRIGLGGLLALGSRDAARSIGGEAPGIAPHVKGLEIPGYDPRRLQTMALGLAVGTRGADHNRSGAYEADFSGRADRLRGDARSAAEAVASEDRAALTDSLILCKFLRGVFSDLYEESAELLRAITGWDVDARELRDVAARVVNARKCLNIRQGWDASEDTLPGRLLADVPDDPGSPLLTRARLDAMIASYYQERGWGVVGEVPGGLRSRLGLTGAPWDAPIAVE